MLTEILRTSFPQADSERPHRPVRDFLISVLFVMSFAIVAIITEPSGTRWNAYYLPALLTAFVVPEFIHRAYRSKKAFTLGYVFASQLLTCVYIMFSYVLMELFINKFPNGVDFCVAFAILFLVVTVEFSIMLAMLQRIASSPKCHLEKSPES